MLLWLMNLGFAAGPIETVTVTVTGVWGSRHANHIILLMQEDTP